MSVQSPEPEVPQGVQEAAQSAHGFITRIEQVAAQAKAELEKFLPASVVNALESEGEQAAHQVL